MSNVVFDGKLIRKVRFTKDFQEELKQASAGLIIIFTGTERDTVSAVCSLMAGLRAQSKYHDAKDVALGVLSWHNRDSGLYESFRFSMEAIQVVGIGRIDKEFEDAVEKQDKFRLWFKQALKHRVIKGMTTIIASAVLADSDIDFFGKDVLSQYGLVVKTSEVLEARHGTKAKTNKGRGTARRD